MPEVIRILSFRNRRKKQVAAYIRVSSTMKAQEGSYDNQAAYYEQKIRANPEWEFAGIYAEKVSGTHAENREAFQRLIRDGVEGKIDLILCKSISRWARNIVDGLQAIQLLTGNGVHIYFEQEGIDTQTPGILLQLNLAASVAQSESESISENMKWSFKHRTAQGKFWAVKGLYFGYDSKGDAFRENECGRYVRLIYDRYLDGMSKTGIAAMLNRMDVKTLRGKAWTAMSVGGILKNEVYVGDIIFRKTPSKNIITGEIDKDWQSRYVRDHHQGIIDRKTWDAVQIKLSERKAGQKTDKKKKEALAQASLE